MYKEEGGIEQERKKEKYLQRRPALGKGSERGFESRRVCGPRTRLFAGMAKTFGIEGKTIFHVEIGVQKGREKVGDFGTEKAVLLVFKETTKVRVAGELGRKRDVSFDIRSNTAVTDGADLGKGTIGPPAKACFDGFGTLSELGAVIGARVDEDIVQFRQSNSDLVGSESSHLQESSLAVSSLKLSPFVVVEEAGFGCGKLSSKEELHREHTRSHFTRRQS